MYVTDEFSGADLQCRIVAPLVRIPDLDLQPGKLVQCLVFGFPAHPSNTFDPSFHGKAYSRHQVIDLRFSLERKIKISCRVDSPDRFPHLGFDKPHTTLPPLREFGNASESFVVKLKIGSDKAFRKVRRDRIDQVKCLPSLQRGNWRSRIEGRALWAGGTFSQNQVIKLSKPCSSQKPAPRKRGGFRKLRNAHRIIGLLGLLTLRLA